MSNEIDWSKAPEGATHCSFSESWFKHDVSGVYVFVSDSWKKLSWASWQLDGFSRKPDQEWTGTGLPPVGIDCEYMKRGGAEWFYCTVIAHHDGGAVVAVHEDDLSYSYWNDSGHFRPIRTPEQIAAEELEKAYRGMIDDLAAVIGISNIDARECDALHALAEAGYRKTGDAK